MRLTATGEAVGGGVVRGGRARGASSKAGAHLKRAGEWREKTGLTFSKHIEGANGMLGKDRGVLLHVAAEAEEPHGHLRVGFWKRRETPS